MSSGLAAVAAAAALYPAGLDAPTLTAWLRESGDIAPEQVVAVSPSAATAILDRLPGPNGRAEVRLRAVALTPQSATRSGVAAWEMPLQVECRTGQIRAGATTGYPARASHDVEVALTAGEAGWRTPRPGTVLESAWRAVCDPSFRPPLAAATRIAQAPAKSATPAPEPAAAPTPRARPPAAASVAGAARNAVATAPPSASPAARRGAVQVVSSPVEAETRATLARLKRRFGASMDGLQPRIEPARVKGRTVYRGVIAGFASRSDAQRFCRTLEQGGQDCLSR